MWELSTMVAAKVRRTGVGKRLIATASQHAYEAGCEWLHVDFEGSIERG